MDSPGEVKTLKASRNSANPTQNGTALTYRGMVCFRRLPVIPKQWLTLSVDKNWEGHGLLLVTQWEPEQYFYMQSIIPITGML